MQSINLVNPNQKSVRWWAFKAIIDLVIKGNFNGNYMELKRVNGLGKINNSRTRIEPLIIKDRSLGFIIFYHKGYDKIFLNQHGKKNLKRIFSQGCILAREGSILALRLLWDSQNTCTLKTVPKLGPWLSRIDHCETNCITSSKLWFFSEILKGLKWFLGQNTFFEIFESRQAIGWD